MKRALFMVVVVLMSLQGDGQDTTRDATRGARFRRSSGELLLALTGPFLFDRYVTREDYARISWSTVGYNLSPGHWTWDNDGFQTNQIGHPYHGSILYNSFRSNGYSFWQSLPAAFAGSYLWETFSENQAPAPNDFINTGFGGVVLGEATHRLAGKLTAAGGSGLRRNAAEVLAFIINPMNGFNRLLGGQWARPGPLPADTTPLRVEFDAGLRKYGANGADPFADGRYGLYGRLHILYGDPRQDVRTPFSHLNIVVEAGQDDSATINVVTVYGSLAGRRLRVGGVNYVAVLSANYDYIHNVAFLYSAQSIRMNVFSTIPLAGKSSLAVSAGMGPVILAAVPNSYLFHTRNYDYGPGFAFNGGVRLDFARRLSAAVTSRGGWMKTVNGNASDYFIHVFTSELSMRLLPNMSVGGELGFFSLHGNYTHNANIGKTYPYLRLSLRYDPFFP